MNKDQAGKFGAWLLKRRAHECAACNSGPMATFGMTPPMATRVYADAGPSETTLTLCHASCSQCGHVAFFDASAVGL